MNRYKIILILGFVCSVQIILAQTLANNGAELTMTYGSSLTIKGDFQNIDDGSVDNSGDIDISGSWENNATSGNLLQGTTGDVHFNGTSVQTIGGSQRTWFSGLHVQNEILLDVETSVSTGLLIDGASLDVNGQMLIMQPGSWLLGANASNYIIAEDNGRLIRQVGNSVTLFPVGTPSSYTPVRLNNAGILDYYGVYVFKDVLDGGTSGTTIPEINNCVNNTWDIIELIPGGSNLNITAQWNALDEGTSFDRTHCGIGHYTGGSWDPQADGVANGSDPYYITRSGISSLSAFAVGDINSPMSFSLDLIIDVTAFLEGPFKGSFMSPDLNPYHIPLSQPYNTSPWDYLGTEEVEFIPNGAVIDWVLVEIRDATSAVLATPATTVARQAAFILANGSIVGLDGSSVLDFSEIINHNLFVVLWHRNHLGVMSANPLTFSGGKYSYNFTTGEAQAYENGHKQIGSGTWGLIAGDGDADGEITTADKSAWATEVGKSGYLMSDYSMNAQVNNQDKNDLALPNVSRESEIPE